MVGTHNSMLLIALYGWMAILKHRDATCPYNMIAMIVEGDGKYGVILRKPKQGLTRNNLLSMFDGPSHARM